MGDTHRYADKSCAEDADKQRARHILDNEHRGEDDAYNAKQGGTRCKVTDAYKRSRVFYNDARILQSDKGNEESDAGSDGSFERSRYGVDDECAYACERHKHKEESLYEDGCKCKLP